MLFRFSKILSIVSFLITWYFLSIYVELYQLESWTQPWVIKGLIFFGVWSLTINTFNWVCFGFFKQTIFMSKEEFENKKRK